MSWYSLRCAGVTDSGIKKLLKMTKDYEEIFKIDKVQLTMRKFTEDDILKISNSKKIDMSMEFEKLAKEEVKLIFIEDEEYPLILKNISQPPLFLFCKGDITLLKGFNIAVVGTRHNTNYGKEACDSMVSGLVKAGITTVSGLAIGIDTICHKKTLEKKGKTIAVVGSGLDKIYPQENKKLWSEVIEKGLLISEFSLGTPPISYNFPQRNRIIAGLSRGILIVESKKKGGSLITADFGLEEGRDVFAIPGEIFSNVSEGCNDLIKNSRAKLVITPDDILIEYGLKQIGTNEEVEILNSKNIKLNNNERQVYDILIGSKNLDELLIEIEIKAGELLAILMELELKGLIISLPGGMYKKKVA